MEGKRKMEYVKIIKEIENNETYQEILKDYYSGIMYGLNTKDKYETSELMKLFNEFINKFGISLFDGIMKGVYHFIMELENE